MTTFCVLVLVLLYSYEFAVRDVLAARMFSLISMQWEVGLYMQIRIVVEKEQPVVHSSKTQAPSVCVQLLHLRSLHNNCSCDAHAPQQWRTAIPC